MKVLFVHKYGGGDFEAEKLWCKSWTDFHYLLTTKNFFMMRHNFLFLFSFTLILSSCTNTKKTSTKIAANSSSGGISGDLGIVSGKKIAENFPISIDTSKKYTYDTIWNNRYNSYTPFKDTVAFFSPMFELDICEPGNKSHWKYKNYMGKAEALAQKTINSVVKSWQINPGGTSACTPSKQEQLIQRLGNIQDLYNCVLIPVPIYYPTFNIVNYQPGENIKKYFDLDTAMIIYRILKGKEMIGLLKHRINGGSAIQCYYPQDSLGYHMITELNKEPIAIRKGHFAGGSFENFASLINNRLVWAACNQGEVYFSDGVKRAVISTKFDINCHMITAETYYLRTNNFGRSNLSEILENSIKPIQFQNKNNGN